MERIWAPWRMEYITNSVKEDGCFFCSAWSGDNDRDNLLLHRTRLSLVMLNRYPYSGGHLMVAPARHTADMDQLSDDEMLDMMQCVRLCRSILAETAHPDGFNIGVNLGKAAGAGVDDHLHIHIVPRWNGDTNFMTVAGDVRVIPQWLHECYDNLAQALSRRQ